MRSSTPNPDTYTIDYGLSVGGEVYVVTFNGNVPGQNEIMFKRSAVVPE